MTEHEEHLLWAKVISVQDAARSIAGPSGAGVPNKKRDLANRSRRFRAHRTNLLGKEPRRSSLSK
jgi:hypothetical protein